VLLPTGRKKLFVFRGEKGDPRSQSRFFLLPRDKRKKRQTLQVDKFTSHVREEEDIINPLGKVREAIAAGWSCQKKRKPSTNLGFKKKGDHAAFSKGTCSLPKKGGEGGGSSFFVVREDKK